MCACAQVQICIPVPPPTELAHALRIPGRLSRHPDLANQSS